MQQHREGVPREATEASAQSREPIDDIHRMRVIVHETRGIMVRMVNRHLLTSYKHANNAKKKIVTISRCGMTSFER